MKKIFISKKAIVLYIIVLLLAGVIWQSIMVICESKKYTAVGEYIDVESFKAHCYSQGEGDIAFIFITGSGTPSSYTDFYNLQNELSSQGQTITFDHAGSGWSTATESERNIENLVKELSIIIETIAPSKPVVLLCHSLGSLEAIGYAQTYPERVLGIVFLDAGSPELYSTYSEFVARLINRSVAFTRVVGINRLFGECGLLLPMYGENIRNNQLPSNLKNIDTAMFYQFSGNSLNLNTIKLINENAATILAGTSLGDIPILVLSSDSGHEWYDVQMQLLAWSKNNKQVTLSGSKHYLHWSNYDEVVCCINEFVKEKISGDHEQLP